MTLSHDLLRYSCQLSLPGFTEITQQRLQNAKVLIVGAGGLGCPSAQYLAAAGVGTIGIADDDVVSIGNLHRQILYTPAEVGQKKAIIAAEKLQQQNPQIKNGHKAHSIVRRCIVSRHRQRASCASVTFQTDVLAKRPHDEASVS